MENIPHNNFDQSTIEYDHAISVHQSTDYEVFAATNEYNRIKGLLAVASMRLGIARVESRLAIENLNAITKQRNLIYTSGGTSRHIPTRIDDKLHSLNDQPAVICENGSQHWYIDGKRHRDNDMPARIDANGNRYWYVDGKKHRDNDRPAVICTNGNQRWYINGKLHRNGDQPATVFVNGDRCWYNDGKLHRGGGQPAVMNVSGVQCWFTNGVQYNP